MNELKNRSFVIVDMKVLKDKKKPQLYGEKKEKVVPLLSLEEEFNQSTLHYSNNCINDYYQ
jgi:hypothetical protein